MKFTTVFLCAALLCPALCAEAQTAPASPGRLALLEVPRAKIAPLTSADASHPLWCAYPASSAKLRLRTAMAGRLLFLHRGPLPFMAISS